MFRFNVSLGFVARADKKFKNNKLVSEFNEKNISNSLKQNTAIKETKTKVTPVQKVWIQMQHLLSKKLSSLNTTVSLGDV